MEIETGDYIVIVISREKDAETAFLKKAGRSNTENWCYSAMGSNCGNKTISKPCDLEINNNQVCYSFYLINAYCWKCHVMHHAECSCSNNRKPSEKIKKLLENIKKNGKKIIVWTHNTDDIPCAEIRELFHEKLSSCDLFSHTSPNHIVEDFMVKVCGNGQNNFQKEFKKLIEAFLKKKPNSILHLFLPLDIDMQALDLLKDEKRKKYLDEMYKDKVNYADKFEVLQSKIKELAEVKEIDGDRLNLLVKDAETFFQNLIQEKINPEKLLTDSWEGKKNKSFHDWYCALAECLRGKIDSGR